jgi:DNA-binding transcriptional LysR family regulator
MMSIPFGYSREPDLHELRVLDVLLRERSLTRAARELDVTQPAISKTLKRLRKAFDDPLFVRVARRMEPTPKASELQDPVRAILERMQRLRSEHIPFDSSTSHRTFNFSVVDAGLIKLLPPLVERLMREAPHVRLNVLQLEAAHLEQGLETGKLDFAMGSFPDLSKAIRRQPLWSERYVGVVRQDHPRITAEPTLRAFTAEQHVLVSIRGSGHAHQVMERALEAAIPPEQVICRIPMFIGAAVLAKHTDAIATLPASIGNVLAADLDLQVFRVPLKLPKIEIFQYWHDRVHRDRGNQWIRSVFRSLFRKSSSAD